MSERKASFAFVPDVSSPEGRFPARIALPVALASVVVVIGAVALVTAGRGDESVREAARRTRSERTARLSIVATLDVGSGIPAAVQAEGVFDLDRRRGRLTYWAGQQEGTEIIVEAGVAYVRRDDQWLGGPVVDLVAGPLGSALSLGVDPWGTLEIARASTKVTKVGGEIVGGEQATHYHAVSDLAGVEAPSLDAFRAGAVPVDVWLDKKGRLRRMVIQGGALTLTVELHDFGTRVDWAPR